jgi:hypothetical protein
VTLIAGPSYRNRRAPASFRPSFPAPTGRTVRGRYAVQHRRLRRNARADEIDERWPLG